MGSVVGKGMPDASGLGHEEVLEHLEKILASPAFRTSHRSCQFLRYVMESYLAGDTDLLKERVIGERVFGRSPDYDTGQDSIVRVKANEVRRRLAQYYDLHPDSPLRIELPAGSYHPVCHAAPAPPAEPPAVAPFPAKAARLPRRWALWAGVAVTGIALAAWLAVRGAPEPALFTAFWNPFLASGHDLIICVPTPETFRIYGDNKGRLIEALKPRPPGTPAPNLSKDELHDVLIVPETGMSLGMGDAHALTLLYAFAATHGKTALIRVGDSTTFTELRAGPNILIGGFTNRWTIDLMKDARFAFASQGADYGIQDRQNGRFVCRKARPWGPRGDQDCAVVTRFWDSKTGHPLLIAAGLDHFGTYEVGEFLTRPELLEPALESAPAGWRTKNLQVVFQTEIVRDNVGPPKVLATYVW